MVLVFGRRTKKIADEQVNIFDNGQSRPAEVLIMQNYAHLLFIPLFPVRRTYYLKFLDNGAEYTNALFSKMPPDYKEACTQVSKKVKTPVWMFVGLVILAALIFWLESRK